MCRRVPPKRPTTKPNQSVEVLLATAALFSKPSTKAKPAPLNIPATNPSAGEIPRPFNNQTPKVLKASSIIGITKATRSNMPIKMGGVLSRGASSSISSSGAKLAPSKRGSRFSNTSIICGLRANAASTPTTTAKNRTISKIRMK